ncbi:GP79 protein [Segniliparus rotundus DSM 44985]|uniref:GP79 protein n=1 Tax=Segniliparus rotundus (strain ATCC BAA-972 / CDC 1076 / CIP 108378 / DSM 44985 / JCM 13578) TaxID=640132 RepID=D6ZFC5_SEGRD|nr:hypothetical protein [Segniliparus rotundus]ADG97649.1 GP79 protein [Segniliparus rotundus DSM 44985]
MINPSDQQVADAAKALGKAALFDRWFAKPEPGMARAWAQAFARFDLRLPDLLDAVTLHYSETGEHIAAADVIRHARAIRRDRAEREKPGERSERQNRLDRRLEAKILELADKKSIDNTNQPTQEH